MRVKRRGASEVLGVLLMTAIVMGIAAVWLSTEAPRISRESMGIIEMLRFAARRQSQLLSLLYYYKDSGNNLVLFLYNYGLENSTISSRNGIILAGNIIPLDQVVIRDAESGKVITNRVIRYKQVVEVIIPNCPPRGIYDLIIRTEEGGVFIWEVGIEG